MLRWLNYNLSFNYRDIINYQYSSLFVFEKFESLSKNSKIIQRSEQRIKKTLQYQNQQLTLYLIADLLNNIFNHNEHILIVYNLSKLIIDFNEFVNEKNKLIREKLNLIFVAEKIDIE